jgi:hypothetical protein
MRRKQGHEKSKIDRKKGTALKERRNPRTQELQRNSRVMNNAVPLGFWPNPEDA